MFKMKPLPYCMSLLLFGAAMAPLHAQEANEESGELVVIGEKKQKQSEEKKQPENKRAKKLTDDGDIENVVVTGSLIPRGSFSGPDPMTVIDEEEMKAKGLITVADVIGSLTENGGYSEGNSGNVLSGFTVGAQEANFRGLGTGRTLVLVNGRRIADYPVPFGGEQNGADLGTIPSAAVNRTEYLSSGASAIYGSDAIGGVVNFITKRDMEQTLVNTSVSTFEGGYGTRIRNSFITGHAFDKGAVTLSLENWSSDAIDGNEIEFLEGRNFTSTGIAARRIDTTDNLVPNYVSPVGYDCEANNMQTSELTPGDGSKACNFDALQQIAYAPEQDGTALFVDGRYNFNDNIRGFATVMHTKQGSQSYNPSLTWSGNVYGENSQTGELDRLLLVNRSFSHDLGARNSSFDQEMWSIALGLEGSIELGDGTWDWDVAYSKTRYTLDQRYDALREDAVLDWVFDGYQGEVEKLDSGLYQVSDTFFEDQLLNNVYRDASADRDALVGTARTEAASGGETLSGKVVGELGDFGGLLYQPVSLALVAEYSSNFTAISPDERSLSGDDDGWVRIGSTRAYGERGRSAIGAEFRLPVLENLELTLASRFDRYDDSSAIGGRSTSQVKFMYSPVDFMTLRGGFSQTFRAPDMFNIYGESVGFSTAYDLLSGDCFNGDAINGCPAYTVTSTRSGSEDLEEEKGKDYSFGVILQPTDNVNLSVDWWKIRLEDIVTTETAYDLVVNEWQCATGARPAGSAFCEDVNSRVIRDLSGQIQEVIIQPQNQEYMELEGVDVRLGASFESEAFGRFGTGLTYSNTLSHEAQKFARDDVFDLRGGELGRSLPTNYSNLFFSWGNALSGFKSVNAALFIQRQGSVDNYVGTKKLEPYYTANLSGSYRFNERLNASFSLRNLTGAEPRVDNTNPVWPGYWSHLQSPFGRSMNVSLSYMLN